MKEEPPNIQTSKGYPEKWIYRFGSLAVVLIFVMFVGNWKQRVHTEYSGVTVQKSLNGKAVSAGKSEACIGKGGRERSPLHAAVTLESRIHG